MENKEQPLEKPVGEMRKRRETMPDGRRYIIFYTFGDEQREPQSSSEVRENV